MEDKAKGPDYRGTWKDWPFITAGVIALVVIAGTMAGGRAGVGAWVLVAALVVVGLARGGTFRSRR